LKKGESKTVRFNLAKEDLSVMDNNGHPVPMKDKISISVGGGQPDAANSKSGRFVQGSIQF